MEKPVIIEKVIEKPVYIVHETPGVVVGREVNIKDSTHTLSQKEIEAFAQQQGLVSKSDVSKTYIAPAHQLHDHVHTNATTQQTINAVTSPVVTTTTTTTKSSPSAHGGLGWASDGKGGHLHVVSEKEHAALLKGQTLNLHDDSKVVLGNNSNWSSATVHEGAKKQSTGGWLSWLWGGNKDSTTTTTTTTIKQQPVKVQTSTMTTGVKEKRQPWFFGNGGEDVSK